MSARDDILDAAAQLFSEQGYAATSTRAIAMAVGIKQASLYYHFTNKEQILAELLVTTVVPSLDAARLLRRRSEPAEVKLWALAAFDVRLLCSGRWNIGALYLLPELRSSRFARFHRQRQELRSAYGELISDGSGSGTFCVQDERLTTDLVFGLVASVVPMRQDQGELDPQTLAPNIADGCLRLLGCPARRVGAARRRGLAVYAMLTSDDGHSGSRQGPVT